MHPSFMTHAYMYMHIHIYYMIKHTLDFLQQYSVVDIWTLCTFGLMHSSVFDLSGQSDGSGEDEMSQMGISGSDSTGGLRTQYTDQRGPSDRSNLQPDHMDYQSTSLWSNSSRYPYSLLEFLVHYFTLVFANHKMLCPNIITLMHGSIIILLHSLYRILIFSKLTTSIIFEE